MEMVVVDTFKMIVDTIHDLVDTNGFVYENVFYSVSSWLTL